MGPVLKVEQFLFIPLLVLMRIYFGKKKNTIFWLQKSISLRQLNAGTKDGIFSLLIPPLVPVQSLMAKFKRNTFS
jgi:hypothetical protein